jgi:hypothetical protein
MDDQSKKTNVSETLMRAYQVLKMTPQETQEALNGLAGLQHLALTSELLKDLTKDEVEELNKIAPTATDEEKQKQIQMIAQKRQSNAEFGARVKVAIEKVMRDHISYLRSRGDDRQKEEITRILDEIQ